ncbi:MAG: DUF2064 domain-containing protein [Croceivirga sp.]
MQSPCSNTTAILIFANSHGVDAARKNIPQSGALFQSLNDDIIAKVRKTGLPYFLYSEELQIGSDFGARFTAAIQSIFLKGYDSVITVGNDTPNLSVSTLQQAHKTLIQGKTVIGPSTDGGIYLLGIHKNCFESIGFRQLPWQERHLFQDTARFFGQMGVLHQLPRLTDIDSIGDIQSVIDFRSFISSALFRLLLELVTKRLSVLVYRDKALESFEISLPFNKGSPSLSL